MDNALHLLLYAAINLLRTMKYRTDQVAGRSSEVPDPVLERWEEVMRWNIGPREWNIDPRKSLNQLCGEWKGR
jgi:hypothetical protein